MTVEQQRALAVRSFEAAAAVQRRILDAGAAIDPEWRRLGWDGVDRALDALLELLPPPSTLTARGLAASR